MAFCGFNAKMLYGVNLFHEGLVEHGVIGRSAMKNKSVDQILADELSELNEFLREMPDITDTAFRDIIQGATLHARGLYSLLTPEQIQTGKYAFALKKASDVMYGMDNEYYSRLESEPERMKKLVQWINNYVSNHK
jgi:hypothetical protein